MKGDTRRDVDGVIERASQGDATEAELAELAAWRRLAPENERHYQQTVSLVAAVRALRPRGSIPPRPGASAIVSAAEAASNAGRARRAVRRWLPWTIAAAAVLAAGLSLRAGQRAMEWEPAEIVTGEAELATVKLGDGTVVRLGPASRLRIESDQPRDVALDGRAFFAVTTMDGRPFRVRTHAATVNVLGTRFELATDPGGVRLRVVEGRVALDARDNSVQVTAGEESDVRNGAATPPTRLADAATVPAWLGEFMVFQATPLHAAAREIERLYDVQLVIGDSTLADATLTASFTDQPIDEVVNVVCTVLNAHCETKDGVVSITR